MEGISREDKKMDRFFTRRPQRPQRSETEESSRSGILAGIPQTKKSKQELAESAED